MNIYFLASRHKSNKIGIESEANCQISLSPACLPDKDKFQKSESQNSQLVTSNKKKDVFEVVLSASLKKLCFIFCRQVNLLFKIYP